MNDPATGNWIVYNGEIYNFREVRAKLEQAGLYFSSDSDTEVILKAYAHWGEECLANFAGCLPSPSGMRSGIVCLSLAIPWESSHFTSASRIAISCFLPRSGLCWELVWCRARIDPAGLLNYLTFGSLV